MNRETFQRILAAQYADLFATDPEYGYAASFNTPEGLARKMTDSLASGAGNKDGDGIRRTCKFLGIPCTYKAIEAYLSAN